MVLLRWSVGAVGAGSVPGGAVGGARFGVLRLGEGRVLCVCYLENHVFLGTRIDRKISAAPLPGKISQIVSS